jgi:hypothetical protein
MQTFGNDHSTLRRFPEPMSSEAQFLFTRLALTLLTTTYIIAAISFKSSTEIIN